VARNVDHGNVGKKVCVKYGLQTGKNSVLILDGSTKRADFSDDIAALHAAKAIGIIKDWRKTLK
jgi:hypothetical protein